jgi:hypothetical protein
MHTRQSVSVKRGSTEVAGYNGRDESRQLARDVKAAIESGEIGLHAHELERFADQLR